MTLASPTTASKFLLFAIPSLAAPPHGVVDDVASAMIANRTITHRRSLHVIGTPTPRNAADRGRDGGSRGGLHSLNESCSGSGRSRRIGLRRLLLLELLELTLLLLLLLGRQRRGSFRLLLISLMLLDGALGHRSRNRILS